MKKKLNVWRLTGCIFYLLFIIFVLRLIYVFPQNHTLSYTMLFSAAFLLIIFVVFALPGTFCFYKANKKKNVLNKEKRK